VESKQKERRQMPLLDTTHLDTTQHCVVMN